MNVALASELILKGPHTHTHTDVNTHKSDGKSGLMGLCISLSQASGSYSAASHSLKDGSSPCAAQYRWIMHIPPLSCRTFPVFECSINILTIASLSNSFGETLNDRWPFEAHHAAPVRAADVIVVPASVMCADYLIKRFFSPFRLTALLWNQMVASDCVMQILMHASIYTSTHPFIQSVPFLWLTLWFLPLRIISVMLPSAVFNN